MSKTQGNVIDPIEQINKYGVDSLRYYLTVGISLTKDSKYDEEQLKQIWNNDIVNGLGNLISRILHLIDIKEVKPDLTKVSQTVIENIYQDILDVEGLFSVNNFSELRVKLNSIVNSLNTRVNDEKPWSSENYYDTLNEIYQHIKSIVPFYELILKDHKNKINQGLDSLKKVILFEKL
jgi:methionyl-tRNA synthetase